MSRLSDNSWEERFDKLEVTYKRQDGKTITEPLVLNDESEKVVKSFIRRERVDLAKAFGGCHKCFGKGFSTQLEGYSAYCAGLGGWTRDLLLPCDCERGRQFAGVIEGIAEMADKAAKQIEGGGNGRRIVMTFAHRVRMMTSRF